MVSLKPGAALAIISFETYAVVGAIALAQPIDLSTWLALILISAAAAATSLLAGNPLPEKAPERQ